MHRQHTDRGVSITSEPYRKVDGFVLITDSIPEASVTSSLETNASKRSLFKTFMPSAIVLVTGGDATTFREFYLGLNLNFVSPALGNDHNVTFRMALLKCMQLLIESKA